MQSNLVTEIEIGFTVRPMKLVELAIEYRVSKKTFRKWLKLIEKEIGKRNGHFYMPAQVELIVKHLGSPPTTDIKIVPKQAKV